MGLDGIRCVNCGAKMKLVNVTRINTFRAPEARQYDVSVSFRKAGSGINQSSSACRGCQDGKRGKKGRGEGRKGS